MVEIILSFAAAILGGGITAIATVSVIRNDVHWLKMSVADLRAAIAKAHERIDQIERHR